MRLVLVFDNWLGDTTKDLTLAAAAFGVGEHKEVGPCNAVGCRGDFQTRANRGAGDAQGADGGQCGRDTFTTCDGGHNASQRRRERFNGEWWWPVVGVGFNIFRWQFDTI